MDGELRKKILVANIEAHDREATVYERAHPEIFGRREQARIRRLILQAVALLPETKRRALDVGCGTGTVTTKLLAHGFTVDALDISQGMLDELAKRLGSLRERVNLVQSDVDSFLGRSPGPYHLIILSSVLHHLPDYTSTLRILVSRLAPGGIILIIHEPVGIEGQWLLRRFLWADAVFYNLFFLPRKAQRIVFGIDYNMVDYQVGRGFAVESVFRTLHSSGCAIIHEERYSALKFRWTSWLIERIFSIHLHFACIAQLRHSEAE